MTRGKVLATAVVLGGGIIIVDGCSTTNVTNIEVRADAAAGDAAVTRDAAGVEDGAGAPIAEKDADADADVDADAGNNGEAGLDAADAGDDGEAGLDAAPDAGADAGLCGNDAGDPEEECDDGNSLKCDGCESCERRQWLNVTASGGFIDVPGGATFLPDGDATYESWVRTSIDTSTFLSSYAAADNGAFLLKCLGKQAFFAMDVPGKLIAVGGDGTVCGDDQWHHVAGTRSISASGTGSGVVVTMTLYWDGLPVDTKSANVLTLGARANVVVGGLSYQKEGLGGSIDEVRISNSVRYTAPFVPARRFAPDASTVLLLHLDEGTGKTVIDSSGGGHNGTSSGAGYAPDTGYRAAMCQ